MQRENHYVYQPIVDMQSLALVRYEALLRVAGVSNIEEYIKGLEHTGAIIDLDLMTLRTVISEVEAIAHPKPTPVAVNISAISLSDSLFQRKAIDVLMNRKSRVVLSLEITETAPIKNLNLAMLFIHKLHRAGCTVGMDDYGEGHANLELIDDLGLDYIKLASSLTINLETSSAARNLCRHAIIAADEKCIDVVAEHIDKVSQYTLLREMGIHQGQGWLFAKAAPKLTDVDGFESYLRKQFLP